MLETHLRHVATVLLESATRFAPADTREWGRAMQEELRYVEGCWAVLMWALGGASVMAKHALASILLPGRYRQGLTPDGRLFAKNVSLRKAALVASGVCVLGALLFLAAPPFRQGIRVALLPWRAAFRAAPWEDQAGLKTLAGRAESQRDAEGLAFCAVRLRDSRESARLAEEAVQLDPNLIWIYAIVATRNPELPEISQWLAKLERRDPQNALLHLITAELTDIRNLPNASRLPPKEFQKQIEADPAWQRAIAAAFASPKLDDYMNRVRELDRKVAQRYGFDDPYELLSGQQGGLPIYAFQDSQRFAKSLLQEGQELEARGDREGAAEKYWAVAKFGHLFDTSEQTNLGCFLGASLQVMAYKPLQLLAEREGNTREAALFGYLMARSDPRRVLELRREDWAWGQEISRRNGAVLQIASVLTVVFLVVMVVAASLLILSSWTDARPGARRVKFWGTVAAFASAVGLLLSAATVYLTYRPYWYILHHAILNGDRGQTRDLRNFLAAIQIWSYSSELAIHLPVYFWTGVTLLGLISLALIFLRHFLARPRVSASA